MQTILPPTIEELLPTLRALPAEQKLFIIHALTDTVDAPLAGQNLAWETGKSLFGDYRSGRDDLSQNAKKIVKQRIKAHHGKSAD